MPYRRLEFVELAAVDDARDHLARVVRGAQIGGHHAVQFRRIVTRRLRRAQRQARPLHAVQPGDDAPAIARRGGRHGVVIHHAGRARMHVGAAQVLRGDDLAGRRLHQRRAAKEDRALLAHDDAFVAHRRHVGAAGGAGAHHHRDLRDALGATCWPG